jgi:DNA-binding MarR family transcriptional regulator
MWRIGRVFQKSFLERYTDKYLSCKRRFDHYHVNHHSQQGKGSGMRHTAEESLTRMKKNWPKAATPTFEVCLSVHRLSDLGRANGQKLASRHGLSLTEIDVLAALRRAALPHELSPTELYSAVLISSGGLTKVLHGLERRGLISRVADDVDRRSRRVRLTPAGKALAERTVAAVQASDEERFSKALSTAEMARLATLLRKLLLVLESDG